MVQRFLTLAEKPYLDIAVQLLAGEVIDNVSAPLRLKPMGLDMHDAFQRQLSIVVPTIPSLTREDTMCTE